MKWKKDCFIYRDATHFHGFALYRARRLQSGRGKPTFRCWRYRACRNACYQGWGEKDGASHQDCKVVEVDAENTKKVSLYVDEFYEPCFTVGDLVLKDGTAATAIADVPTIEKIERNGNNYIVTLSKAIAGLVKDDVLVEVVSDGQTAAKSKERGTSNSVLIADVEVGEFETSVDVSADTMQYAMYERRVPPIPAGQKDTTGDYLKGNPHVKLTKSH